MEETGIDETFEGTGIVIEATNNPPFRRAPVRIRPKRVDSRNLPLRLWGGFLAYLAGLVGFLALYGGIRLADNHPAPFWLIVAFFAVVAVGFGVQAWRGR